MKKMAVLLCLILSASSVSWAEGASVTEFLSSAALDPTLHFQNEKVDFLNGSSANTPLIREVEFRARIDQFKESQQRYGVRLSPTGWGETRNGRKVYKASLEYNEAQLELLLNKALRRRYRVFIDYVRTQDLLDLNRKLMEIGEDRLDIKRKSIDDLDSDPTALVEAEDDVIQLQLDIIDLENSVRDLEDEIKTAMGANGPVSLDPVDLIDIDAIKQAIENFSHPPEAENIHIRRAHLSTELAENRYNLEKAENRRYLSFFQFDYEMDERRDFEEAMILRFGIMLPIVNPNRLDIDRRKLTSLREKSDLENLRREVAGDITFFLRDLERSIAQYDILLGRKAASNAESSLEVFQRIEGTNPLKLLKMKKSMLKTEVAITKMKRRILRKYVNLLDVSGKLFEKPLRNHLSTSLEPLEL
jgi:outer membrane protein TolC